MWKALGGLALRFRSKARRCLVRALDAVMCLREEVCLQGRAVHRETCVHANHDLASLCLLPPCLHPLSPHNTAQHQPATPRTGPCLLHPQQSFNLQPSTPASAMSHPCIRASSPTQFPGIHSHLPCGRVHQYSRHTHASAFRCVCSKALPPRPVHTC